jgi:hypothetical protein
LQREGDTLQVLIADMKSTTRAKGNSLPVDLRKSVNR